VQWSELYEREFFSAPGCYLECGGYCCNNFFGRYYAILDRESVMIPMTDDEYEVYRSRGGIENVTVTRHEIAIGEGKRFVFYLLSCKEKGLCRPHANRPMVCRLYPRLPRVDEYGEIIGFNEASLMDLFYQKSAHPCPLVAKDQGVEEQIARNFPKPDAKTIFALMLADAVMKALVRLLPEKLDTADEEQIRRLARRFEAAMLGGKIFRSIDVVSIYKKVAAVHGEFL